MFPRLSPTRGAGETLSHSPVSRPLAVVFGVPTVEGVVCWFDVLVLFYNCSDLLDSAPLCSDLV